MGRVDGSRKADRPQRRATVQRGALLATIGVLAVFAIAIGALALAASRDHATVAGDSQPVGYRAPVVAPTSPSSTPDRAPATTQTTTKSTPRARSHSSSSPKETPRFEVVQGRHLTRVKKAKKIVVVKPTTFRVASFNLLGASHTAGSNARKGYASGPRRLVGELEMIRNKGVTVAGLQEFQPPQVDEFHRLTGGTWTVYPGTSVDNSIVWLTSEWTLVKAETHAFPYFHGHQVQDPVVLLKNIDSGRTIWFVNVHSPADVHGMHNAGLRAATVAREAALVDELNQDGTPVVLTGDMNDRALFACSFTRQSGMHSSDGWHTAGGTCYHGTGYPNVDWILGSDQVSFTDGVPDFASEHRHLSDHPIITATATIAGTSSTG